MRGARSLPSLALLLAFGGEPGASPPVPDPPTAGGRLAWALEGDLDLVGDLWADLPWAVGRAGDSLYLSVDTRTDMDRPTERLAFELQDLQYDVDFGWRARRRWAGERPLFAFAGQRGKALVDAEGHAHVVYLGLGVESRGFREPARERLDFRVAAGPVLGEHDIEGSFVARGSFRLWLLGAARSALGLDLRFDGLLQDDGFHADVALGPRLVLPAQGAHASLFLTYQHSDHPLGRSEPLWLLGFGYEQGSSWPDDPPAEIEGLVSAGGGAGRGTGQLRLGFHSPAFGQIYRAVALVDANVLTSENDSDLFYLYHVGVERPWRGRVAGAYFFHRSNHLLGHGGNPITAVNALEGGLETPGWDLPGRRAETQGLIEFRARAGYLLDSAFGEDRLWRTQAGLRLNLLSLGRVERKLPQPYLVAEAEDGDVERRKYAVGLAPLDDFEIELAYRSDDQYFSADPRLWLLTARYGLGSRPRTRPR